MKFSLDIDDSLHQKIVDAAEKNKRTVGKQYEYDLESIYGDKK